MDRPNNVVLLPGVEEAEAGLTDDDSVIENRPRRNWMISVPLWIGGAVLWVVRRLLYMAMAGMRGIVKGLARLGVLAFLFGLVMVLSGTGDEREVMIAGCSIGLALCVAVLLFYDPILRWVSPYDLVLYD